MTHLIVVVSGVSLPPYAHLSPIGLLGTPQASRLGTDPESQQPGTRGPIAH